jgi:tRNA(Ile)-lysidine synthase
MLLNLVKGTGINGITGIKTVNNDIIRPLLFTDKNAILAFLKDGNIKYRKDESNDKDDYQRNYLRNRVIPLLQDLNPSLTQTLKNELNIFQCVAYIYNEHIEKLKTELILSSGNDKLIAIEKIKSLKYPDVMLFDILKEYNFNQNVLLELIKNIDNQSGKEYLSSTHRILKDREYIIITNIDRSVSKLQEFQLPFHDTDSMPPIDIKMEITSNNNLIFSDDKNIALLNCEKLSFPLKVRKWQKGDVFYPLGANGKQKVSDFFINNKISKFEKEDTYLVLSDDNIVWVVGNRIDDRYKIGPDTTSILKLTLTS